MLRGQQAGDWREIDINNAFRYAPAFCLLAALRFNHRLTTLHKMLAACALLSLPISALLCAVLALFTRIIFLRSPALTLPARACRGVSFWPARAGKTVDGERLRR
ncbi:hypothetical protein AVEN_99252-1 [Araneus ventricosus]|uniref:Uncharacterized protein n=1 Tax=Araneus ventricosus TaxID=182803 RepID=A0A4Y2V5C0_ARAVE|nr:hypothetical protein AVEN_99252-1 [Araneus ventricosus]